jgi:hypothetical protein
MQQFVHLIIVMEAGLCTVNTPGVSEFGGQRVMLLIHCAGITAM